MTDPGRRQINMDSVSTYTYRPLDDTADAVRLIDLLQGSEKDEIRCHFVYTTLSRAAKYPGYEALSYE
jgi:hypothetical protein